LRRTRRSAQPLVGRERGESLFRKRRAFRIRGSLQHGSFILYGKSKEVSKGKELLNGGASHEKNSFRAWELSSGRYPRLRNSLVRAGGGTVAAGSGLGGRGRKTRAKGGGVPSWSKKKQAHRSDGLGAQPLSPLDRHGAPPARKILLQGTEGGDHLR